MDYEKIFIISYVFNDFEVKYKFFNNLISAQNELKNISKTSCEYKYYDYKIMVYFLINDEYKFTNQTYSYIYGEFIEN